MAQHWPRKTVDLRSAGSLAFEDAAGARLGVAAVVGHEHDHGVVEHAALLEAFDERADAAVEAVDHRGVDGHDVVEVVFVFVAQRVPLGHIGRQRRQRPLGIDEAHFDLPLVAVFAELVPTDLVFAAVAGDSLPSALAAGSGRHECGR